jgi:hypothetical protein
MHLQCRRAASIFETFDDQELPQRSGANGWSREKLRDKRVELVGGSRRRQSEPRDVSIEVELSVRDQRRPREVEGSSNDTLTQHRYLVESIGDVLADQFKSLRGIGDVAEIELKHRTDVHGRPRNFQ